MANYYNSYPPWSIAAASSRLLHPQAESQQKPYGIVTKKEVVPDINILPRKPNNYRCYSIFVLICSCWLCGLVALFYSCKVDRAYKRGDIVAARKASDCARKWNFAGVLCGITDYVVMACIWLLLFYGIWRVQQ